MPLNVTRYYSAPKLKLTETLQKYAIGYLQSVRYYKKFSTKKSRLLEKAKCRNSVLSFFGNTQLDT